MASHANSTTAPASRRGFLRSLASLPLIGGGITLIGNPTRAAEPITEPLLDSYEAWLHFERRYLQYERTGAVSAVADYPFVGRDGNRYDMVRMDNAGANYHWRDEPGASTRAALVLSAVGCDWRRRT